MKTLQILPSLEVGGVERGVIDLAKAMTVRGQKTVVISSGGALVQELQRMGVTHYSLPVHEKSLFSLRLVPKITAIIRRENIDLVHARSRVPAWIGWLAARAAGVPFVTTCHGYYSTHLLSRVMGWGKRVIVISNSIGRHMIDDFGVAPERIRLIHRGLDLTQFRPSAGRYDHKPSVYKIINIGRLSPIKGQLEFLKAVHLLKQRVPAIEILIVGSEDKGKSKYTESLKQTLRQLGLESCVRLLGTRRDIPELLANADLLVLATRVPEAFGRVVIEAGAVGTAVLATRVGGVLDVIEDGENGRLVPPGDISAMARAMEEMLTDRKKSKGMALALQEKVHTRFTLDQMMENTLHVYEEVLEEKKIAVIKLGAAGDVILATPSFRMLRRRYPKSFMALIIDKNLAGLVSASGHFDEMVPVDRKKLSQPGYLLKLAKKLRQEGFDIFVDFQNTKWTHLLAFLSGAGQRYGFARGRLSFLLNRPDHSFEAVEPPVKHQFRILSKLGVTAFDDALELIPAEGSEQKAAVWFAGREEITVRTIGLVIGSSPAWPTKRWPAEFFEELAVRLTQRPNVRVVLIGSPEDMSLAEHFRGLEGDKILNLTGQTTLEDLISVIKRLDVLVTGDTAPLHVAAAVRVKIVSLFGPTDPHRHMPPASDAVVPTRRLECQPCYSGRCTNREPLACLRKIPVDEVYDAVLRQLAAVTARGKGAAATSSSREILRSSPMLRHRENIQNLDGSESRPIP